MTTLKSTALTARERVCLHFVARGQRDAEIGVVLSISEATARQHVSAAVRKLGARTRPQAVAIAIANNLIQIQL
jgi:DNA-binding CsgD family transcriptional regulator